MTVNTEEHLERYILYPFSAESPLCLMEEILPAIHTNGGKKGVTVSTAVVCSDCRRVWLTVETTPSPGWPDPIWHTELRKCFIHGDGSLLSQHGWKSIEFFDNFNIRQQKKVILREILALKNYIAEQKER